MDPEKNKPEPMTREEAKRILRRLELDAYSAVVTAFRAQGDLDKSKKSILGELSNQLSISTERHRAEVRRVVNDDRLNAIAECMHGPGTSTEWSIEGCRLVSLMPRLVPQTVFTAKATAAANQAVENNQKLPIKSEIEVLPLPTKVKTAPHKNDSDGKDDKSKSLTANDTQGKIDDKLRKKKKPNILYTKPSPLTLNKTLSNPFKPSSTPTSLKTMIKNTPLKYSSMPGGIPKSTSTASSQQGTYPQKPIILQRSPAKTLPTVTRASSINLQAVSSSLNTPLSSLGSLNGKADGSTNLVQPMIKVVSNSQNIPVSVSSIGVNAVNSSITQKIKFKTPLPKPKVKATKFKPMVPMQRPSILSSGSLSSESILQGITSGVTTQASPTKAGTLSQGMSVKVVQVTKSQSSSQSSLINSLNKPVVVVSNSSTVKTSGQKLTFNAVPSSLTTQMKTPSTSSLSTSITQSLPKGTLTSKSMPLATGFKMIAVTTVVPGTTQVKTVYIATPIMSLTKTISRTTSCSITTPATQHVRHVPSSLASNLQSVVARSINTNQLTNIGKAANINNISITPSPNSTLSANKIKPLGASTSLATTSTTATLTKGLGSLKTTLVGAAQSLKLFTAVSKSNKQNTAKAPPLLPSTNLVTSIIGQSQSNVQKLGSGNLSVKQSESDNNTQSGSSSSYLNISNLGLNTVVPQQLPNGEVSNIKNPSLVLNPNSIEEVNATLNLLNEENTQNTTTTTTEQITATATADTDDMAFLNAGEKFLEQLSAKMTATSPDSFTKNDTFLFPSNLALDLTSEASQQLIDGSNYELSSGGITIDKAVILQNGNGVAKSQQQTILAKEPNQLTSQKVLQNSPKVLNNLLPTSNKINPASSALNFSNQNSPAGVNQTVMVAPVFQPKPEPNPKTVLNYTNITNVSKGDLLGKDTNSIVGFLNVTGNMSGGVTIDPSPHSKTRPLNSMTLSSPKTPNKLPMSIPGSSKLNISPLLVNNNNPKSSAELLQPTSNIVSNNNNNNIDSHQQHSKQQIINNKTLNPLSSMQFFISSSQNATLSTTQHEETVNGATTENLKSSGGVSNDGNKKRKFADITSSSRAQASWVRSAANLLTRVSRFRGVNKQKGDIDAASWFTRPVDPDEEPGYYNVIKTPMDFGKIKRKLEEGEYETYTQFYEDMVLVKKNCYAYNPADHIARKDCDDVFAFFEGEYRNLLDKWEKHHVSPQKRSKISEENGNS